MRSIIRDIDLDTNLALQEIVELEDALGNPQQADPLLDQIAALGTPVGDRLMFYDQSGNVIAWLALGTNLSIVDTTLNATGGGTPGADSVTNTELANMATKTYKGRTAGTTGDPEDVPVATLKTDLGLVKSDVGLANVDNTSDVDKPVSTAQQTALDLKAPIASPTFTGTVAGITKAMVGLSNVDNTSDAAKFTDTPLTGNPTAPTQTAGNNTTRLATTAFVATAVADLINSAPGLLDTLDEIAAALGDDPNFAATMTSALAGKLAAANNLSDLANAGTARSNLGVAIGSQVQAYDADLAAIAALATAAYGRDLLTLANQAALMALLATVSSGAAGLAPASGGGTANYLRADGTWAAPPGTGGALTYSNGTLTSGDITMTNASQFYTGTSVSLTAGTWLLMGHITLGRAATTLIRYTARIRNTTDAVDLASSQMTQPSQNPHYVNIHLSTVVVIASGTKTIEIQAAATTGACLIKRAAADNSAGNNATQITAVKIG